MPLADFQKTLALSVLASFLLLEPSRSDDSSKPAPLPASVNEGKKLLTDGDRLADDAKPNEAVVRYKDAFEELLPGLRGLPFFREVKRDQTAREDIRKVILDELEEEVPAAEFEANEEGMKALGFLPHDFDLKETMLALYTEQIAAFYDPKTDTMHLIREPAVDPEKINKKPGLLERLLGAPSGFDKDQNKTVIAHELTHALADQHFDLEALQKLGKGNDDYTLAITSLIEGEATLAMLGAQMEDWSGERTQKMSATRFERMMGFLMPLMRSAAGGEKLSSAPPILSETLTFPYLRGLIFCAYLTNGGGWDAVNKAYGDPPRSTEQILHPVKYLETPRDEPTSVDLGPLSPGGDWSELGRNVVGELQTSILLQKQKAALASAGWDGDAFAVFRRPDRSLGLIWVSTWDTPGDAREFAENYIAFQSTKLGPKVPSPDATPDRLRRLADGKIYAVERSGSRVSIVEGFDPETTDALLLTLEKQVKLGGFGK